MTIQAPSSLVIRDAREAVEALGKASAIALDLETTGLHPVANRIALINMYAAGCPPAIISIRNGVIPHELQYLFTNPTITWITHNGANFDLEFLFHAGVQLAGPHYDTLVGEQVLATHGRHDVPKTLAATMKRRIGRNHKLEISHESWANTTLTEEQLDYAVNDVLWLHDIKANQEQLAEERSLHIAMANEQRLTKIVARMCSNGIALPYDNLVVVRNGFIEKAKDADARLRHEFGPSFNVNAHKGVREALAIKGFEIPDTQKATLVDIEDDCPWAADVLSVRASKQRTDFYKDEWCVEHIHNGRVYPKFWQVGADTTRFIGTDPNLQQIPRNMRQIFGNEPGMKVVFCDYSQLESRIHAYLAQDWALIESLDGELDLYEALATAGGLDPANHFEFRQIGKVIALAWFFGGREKGMVIGAKKYGVKTTEAKIAVVLDNCSKVYRATVQYIRHYEQRIKEFKMMRRPMKIDLPWGHYRILLSETGTLNQILNTKVQGRAAIGIKEAIFDADRRGLTKYLSLQVHDELVASSVPEAEAADYGAELHDAMIAGMYKVCDSNIPIKADLKIMDHWVK